MSETDSEISLSIPRLMLAGVGPNVGLSVTALGLLVGLKRERVAVGAARIGPSLVETTHFRRITEHFSHNLDPWLLTLPQMKESLARLSSGSELLLIEGTHGLCDTFPDDFNLISEAEIAQVLQIPVVLLVDAQSLNEGIIYLLRGFRGSSANPPIAAVLANRVRDEQHNQQLKKHVESEGLVYLGGTLANDDRMKITSDRSSSLPKLLRRETLLSLGKAISEQIDFDKLKDIARSAPDVQIEKSVLHGKSRKCRIAVADDAAFHLSIQDNLELLRRLGAELVPVSPLADMQLPDHIGGVYFPGGHVEEYVKDLRSNKGFQKSLRDFVIAGGVMYAEGTAEAYLSRGITLGSKDTEEMVGLYPGTARFVTDSSLRNTSHYCTIIAASPSFLLPAGQQCRGVRNPDWIMQRELKAQTVWKRRERLAVGDESALEEELLIDEGVLLSGEAISTSAYLHWGSNPSIATRFVEKTVAAHATVRD